MKVSQVCRNKRSLSFEIYPPKKDSELRNIDATLEVLSDLKPASNEKIRSSIARAIEGR